ncbi:aminotransferase class I/II-fold pyridoxal phosphate-dependent enzyme [[Clostridium] polysaccharolyticum]|uniref:alanine transaminase n=1 Tax=[Clostridium] polysaccharolyticum TaxID=29364 RepID=A0A1I0AR51_9FIRM|nr:aminotransferase class I/II-fold pyridoxal phosphate-dependent enzyme [[Clostridium] polysaccharolyticum]SES96870.1 alanine-synthesizing transaminase [[Clostridium] polysaccharolyticum]
MKNSTFAERLIMAMNNKNLKQVDLIRFAETRGIKLGKSQVSQYVGGKAVPRNNIAMFLAETLDVTIDWLYGNQISEEVNIPDTTAHLNENELNINGGDGSMRVFKKSAKLDNVLYDVRGPVVEEAARMEEAGMHVLKLNIGNPAPFGFRTPDEVIYDMQRQLTDCEGYSAAKGLFSARKAIMQYAQLKGIPNLSVDDIYTGNGVSELINLSMSALLDNGDEVLVPSPDYPLWTACVTLAGGNPVHYICDEQAEWYPDMDDIRKKITDKTKAIVVINPNNPTGALYPREVLQEIVEIAREHHLIIYADEIYDRLVMDGEEHISIASLAPDLFCVTFSGLSKSHMIAGYRIGWMILSGNKQAAEDYMQGLNMLSNMRLCSNVPAQSIVQTALGGYQSVNNYIIPGGRIYEQREFIYKALNDIPGISAVKPKAAFYIFPKIDTKKFNIADDEKFALDLLKEKKILLIHGGGFNWKQPDHFRVVYLPRIEVLKDAIEKLGNFLSTYRQ